MITKKHQKVSDYTTIGIGGPVSTVYLPANEAELTELFQVLRKEKRPYRIIGNGSNVLADDRGIRESLVCTRKLEHFIEFHDTGVTVDAGYPMAQLSYQTASHSLSGLEFAVGIPGSIGGVVRMNAGAHNQSVSQAVESVRILLPDGRVVVPGKQELNFGYRYSAIPRDAIILAVNLRLTHDDSKKIHERIREYNEHRTSTQPLKEKSAGCIFRNPGPAPAGKLIEDSGLKGFAIGGAVVSEIHANFIVNRNQATFQDVLALIDHIKKTVHEKQGVQLEEEVIIWRYE